MPEPIAKPLPAAAAPETASDPLPDLLRHLAEQAANGSTQSYGAMAKALGLRLAQLTDALERLMEADHASGSPLGAALCRSRLGDGLPALGFFQKAASLGYEISDPAAFVASHRQALYTRHRNAP